MSIDRPTTPANFIQQDHERKARMDAIDTVRKATERKLSGMHQKITRPRNYEDTMKAISFKAQKAQIESLMGSILYASEYEDPEPINIDNAGLLQGRDFMEPGYFQAREDYIQEAVNKGERDGTSDTLKLLVPKKIVNQQMRELWYLPWRQDLLRRRMVLTDHEDGSATATIPTELPNMNVYLFYKSDTEYPMRFIALDNNQPS